MLSYHPVLDITFDENDLGLDVIDPRRGMSPKILRISLTVEISCTPT
jgi:hypothetical protein